MAGRNRLTILVDAKNNASGQLRSVGSDVSSIAEQINGAFSLDGAIAGLGELSPALGAVASAAVGVGAAVGAWQMAKAAVDLGRLGAESLRTSQGLEDLASDAGTSANEILNALRTASAGAINNQQLTVAASRAMMLGVATSAEEMAALMTLAIDRGRKLGMGAQQSFDDLVTGLGRGSAQILDNLAIMVDSEQVYGSYAASVGKVASALSDAEKKQAIINSVMAEGRDLMREQGTGAADAASSFERMDAAISNSKAALGELFAPAVAVVAENIARAAELAAEGITAMQDSLDEGAALGNVQALEASLQRQNDEMQRAREFLSQIPAGTEEYAAQLRVISDSELQAVRTSRELADARNAYFAALRALYPAEQQNAESLNRTSIEAEAAANAQQYLAASTAQLEAEAAAGAESLAAMQAEYAAIAERSDLLASAQSSLASIASQMLESIGQDQALAMYDSMNVELQQQIANWQAVGYTAAQVQGILLPAYISQLRDATVGSLNLANSSRQAATELARVQSTALGAAQGLNQTGASFNFVSAAANAMVGQVAAAEERLASFASTAAASMASDLVQDGGAGAAIAYYNTINGQIGAQTEKWKAQGYTIEQIESVLLPGYVSGLRKATTHTANLLSGTNAVGQAAAQVSQEYNDLESKVSGVISGALGDIGGINLDDMLPRQDSVSEDARRLADVAVNGFASPWASYFQQEFPQLFDELTAGGDIQGAAAQMLRDFQDGLRPELIDKDRAKEIVKRALLGDQNRQELIDEITRELSHELGISMQKAQQAAQTALGGGGGGAASLLGDGGVTAMQITPKFTISAQSLQLSGDEAALIGANISTMIAPKLMISAQSLQLSGDEAALISTNLSAMIAPKLMISAQSLSLNGDEAMLISSLISSSIGPVALTVVPAVDSNSDTATANFLVAGSNLAMGIMEAVRAFDLPGALAYELSGEGMYEAGSNNGTKYAQGFIEYFDSNVPGHVLDTLADLVYPRIEAKAKANQSRKAAS